VEGDFLNIRSISPKFRKLSLEGVNLNLTNYSNYAVNFVLSMFAVIY
jgi:hypothetical protein